MSECCRLVMTDDAGKESGRCWVVVVDSPEEKLRCRLVVDVREEEETPISFFCCTSSSIAAVDTPSSIFCASSFV